MKMRKGFIAIGLVMLLSSCIKEYDQERANPYDQEYTGTRDYSLSYSHTTVDDSGENDNGIWEPDEAVVLHIYFTNNGPDPALIREADTYTTVSGNGFSWDIGTFDGGAFEVSHINHGDTYDGIWMGKSSTEGYEVNYIDPGTTDYIQVAVDGYGSLNDTIPFGIEFTDWDKQIRSVEWLYPTY